MGNGWPARKVARTRNRERRVRELMGVPDGEEMPVLRLNNAGGKWACAIARKRAFFTVTDALTELVLRQARAILDEAPSFPVRVYRCSDIPEDVRTHYHLTSQAYRVACSQTMRSPLYVVEMAFDDHEPAELMPEPDYG